MVLEADKERRRLRLGIKQLQPTSIDEYMAEHKSGETVSGRVVDVSGSRVKVELGEGVFALQNSPSAETGSRRRRIQSRSFVVDRHALAAMEVGRRREGGPGSAPGGPGPQFQDHQLGCRDQTNRAGTAVNVTFPFTSVCINQVGPKSEPRCRPKDGRLHETALIRAAQQGDRAAFEQLVRAYDQSVLRLAMNLLRSPEDARDVYQEAFLRVFRNLDSFRFDCGFHTWLYRIVTNLCLDHLRKRKVRKEEPTIVATPDGPLDRMDMCRKNGRRRSATASVQRPDPEARQGSAGELTPRERMVFECAIIRECACGGSARSSAPPRKPPRIVCSGRRKKCEPL